MRRLGLAFLLLTCTSTLAQIPIRVLAGRSETSRTVVNSYCRMDYQGFRLGKDSWSRLKPLTTWKDNPDWQGFTVVSQYDVLPASDGIRAATVQVRYTVVGRFERGLGYTAEPGREEVSFRLKDVDGEWKIEELDPAINPHVSKTRAIAWLKSALPAEKDVAGKFAIEKALKDLGAKSQ